MRGQSGGGGHGAGDQHGQTGSGGQGAGDQPTASPQHHEQVGPSLKVYERAASAGAASCARTLTRAPVSACSCACTGACGTVEDV